MTDKNIYIMHVGSIVKAFMNYLDKNSLMDPVFNSRAKISEYEFMIFKMVDKFDAKTLSEAYELVKHDLDVPAGTTHIEAIYNNKGVATFQIS